MSGKRIFPGNLVVNKEIHTNDGVDKINVTTLSNSTGTQYRLVYGDNTTSSGHNFNTGNMLYTPNTNRLSVHTPLAVNAISAQHAHQAGFAGVGQATNNALYVKAQGSSTSATNAGYGIHAPNTAYTSYPNLSYNEHYVSQKFEHYNDWVVRRGLLNATCGPGGTLAGSVHNHGVDLEFKDIKVTLRYMMLANGYFNGFYTDAQHDWWQKYHIIQAYIGQIGSDTQQFTISVKRAWKARSYSVTSDSRIKKNFEELDDLESLEILRKLKPSKYWYKSKINGSQVQAQIGFIAQEVKEVLPDAVTLKTEVIPNIQIFADIMYISTNNTYKIILDEYPPSGTTILENDVLEIYLSKNDINKKTNMQVTTVENKKIFYVEDMNNSGFFNEITENSKVFVYGTSVDDFHALQKDKIWTVGVAALQQIDREHQMEKQKTADLETKYVNLNKEISELETQIDTIISRIQSLS